MSKFGNGSSNLIRDGLRNSHIQVILDGGHVEEFPSCGDLAFDFMDMMEAEHGYSFHYRGDVPGYEHGITFVGVRL